MRRRRWIGTDAGMTLVELMVAMTLLLGLSTMIVMFVSSAVRVQIHNDDENRGLSDAKVILDRLARDIRSARAATCNDSAYLATLSPALRDADLADPTCRYRRGHAVPSRTARCPPRRRSAGYSPASPTSRGWDLQRRPRGRRPVRITSHPSINDLA